MTHTDVKPKRLMELVQRLEGPGHVATCSGSRKQEEEDDVIEPEIDVDGDHDDIAEDATEEEDLKPVIKSELPQDLRRASFCGFSIEQLMRK